MVVSEKREAGGEIVVRWCWWRGERLVVEVEVVLVGVVKEKRESGRGVTKCGGGGGTVGSNDSGTAGGEAEGAVVRG